ncbi:MAG: FtsX-like permease family protein [Gammaproteobacteria bacterium]|nr:FtsX-like permease family protein [Gammaproteobacteria bacterium]
MMRLAMAIGVAAVVVLTSLGEGARRYVTGEFQALGTELLIVLPGRSETTGVQPGMFAGETPRDLTLDDARSLLRIPGVARIAPLVIGSVPVAAGELTREVPVVGSNSDFLAVRNLSMAQGSFLPPGELDRDLAVCVLGSKVRSELFPRGPAVGATVRIGDRRFRVIGVLADTGRAIGFDLQELVIIPVSSAQQLFNTQSLFRIMIQATSREAMPRVREAVRAMLKERHQGEEDVTVITQDAVLATFNRIFTALTLTLAGIASISLAVAGILIMNVMLVAVSQRTAEVGLMKALGARGRQITAIFLTEAVLLSIVGALGGLVIGFVADAIVSRFYPTLPLGPPPWAVVLAVLIAVASGVVFGLLPARRAARLDPVVALAGRR